MRRAEKAFAQPGAVTHVKDSDHGQEIQPQARSIKARVAWPGAIPPCDNSVALKVIWNRPICVSLLYMQ